MQPAGSILQQCQKMDKGQPMSEIRKATSSQLGLMTASSTLYSMLIAGTSLRPWP